MTQEPRPHPAIAATSFEPDLSGRRFFIEDVYPAVESGRFPVKRIAGESIDVWADIFRDGHEVIAASLRWRRQGERRWHAEPMSLHENDRWSGTFIPSTPGRYYFAIEAWTDAFAT
ncbi:MAG: maltotransferase domain-containing protein, partial [Bradyrhizobium sp.]